MIDRANAQIERLRHARGRADDTVAGTTGGTDTGGTDGGGTTGDPDAPDTTVVGSTDPCAPPEGASDGCGGTTGCGGDGCNDVGVAAEPPPTSPCKVQPDGTEICEFDCAAGTTVGGTDDASVTTTIDCAGLECPDPGSP